MISAELHLRGGGGWIFADWKKNSRTHTQTIKPYNCLSELQPRHDCPICHLYFFWFFFP